MHLTDTAIILSVRKQSETSGLVRAFTRQHGMLGGLMRGAFSKAKRGIAMPGNIVDMQWSARLAEHLGSMVLELEVPVAASLLHDRQRLTLLQSLCTLLETTFPEHDPHPRLYDAVESWVRGLLRSTLAGEHDAPWRIGGGKTDFATTKAQEMRKEPTEAEKKLWDILSNKQLGYKFRRQQPIENYIVDFYNVEKRLVIEVDGGQHAENSKDEQRTKWLEAQGIKVLRFWNNEVLNNLEGVYTTIQKALEGAPHAVSDETAAPPQGGSRSVLTSYIQLELQLLSELGFGLDLTECAATGQTDDLAYVSPKSGRAVSRGAGEPYKEKLLPLPAFLHEKGEKPPVSAQELIDGLRLTGYFLEHWVYAPRDRKLPEARHRLQSTFSTSAIKEST